MNNSNRYVFPVLCILLVVALFVAMSCSYFLPFGDEIVFAEVSSLTLDTNYLISSDFYTLSPSSFGFYSGGLPLSGYYYVDNSVYRFDTCYYDTAPDYWSITLSMNTDLSFSYDDPVISFDDSTISYSDIDYICFTDISYVSNTVVEDILLFVLSPYSVSPVVDYTPVFTVDSSDFDNVDSYLLGLLGYNSSLIWYPVTFYSGIFTSIQFTNYRDLFFGVEDPMPHLIFEYSYNFKDGDRWYHDNNTTYDISLNTDGVFLPIFNCYFNTSSADSHNKTWFIQPVSFYYDGYSDYKYEFDLTGNTWIDNQFCNIANTNTINLDIYSSEIIGHLNQSSYNLGYADGMDADQTLISAVWAVFDLPFKLLFGTWDTANSQYVGGLFNFHILGVDIRAFVLGLMSACIVVAIIRFILGSKS